MSFLHLPSTPRVSSTRLTFTQPTAPSLISGRAQQLTAASSSNGAHYAAYPNGVSSNGVATPEPPSETVQQLLQEAGYDLDSSGLRFLSNAARVLLLCNSAVTSLACFGHLFL